MGFLINNQCPSLTLEKNYVSNENLDSKNNLGNMKDKIRNLKKTENPFEERRLL